MLDIYRTDDAVIHEADEYEPGCWIKLTAPTADECEQVADDYGMDIDDVRAALDEEESSRISVEDDYTLILIDIPIAEERNDRHTYTTIPLGILLRDDVIITVCSEETSVLRSFIDHRVREFSTKKRMRFTYQILYNSSMVYQSLLRTIDRQRTEIEEKVTDDLEDSDLIDLHELESNLVYFATSLRANNLVVDRLTRYSKIKQYDDDRDILEDVIVETKQAIEMTSIYRDIISGTRDLMSTVINNRLNNAMKYLAAITIVLSVPTIIGGLWGMNVDSRWMPLSHTPFGFAILCVITLVISIITTIVLHKRQML